MIGYGIGTIILKLLPLEFTNKEQETPRAGNSNNKKTHHSQLLGSVT